MSKVVFDKESFGWVTPVVFDKASNVNAVNVRRYRIVVELIDEDESVILDRLISLYHGERNWHSIKRLNAYGRRMGIDLAEEYNRRKEAGLL